MHWNKKGIMMTLGIDGRTAPKFLVGEDVICFSDSVLNYDSLLGRVLRIRGEKIELLLPNGKTAKLSIQKSVLGDEYCEFQTYKSFTGIRLPQERIRIYPFKHKEK